MSNKSHLDRDVGCVCGFLSIYRGNAMFRSGRRVAAEAQSPFRTRQGSGRGGETSVKQKAHEKHHTRTAVGLSG